MDAVQNVLSHRGVQIALGIGFSIVTVYSANQILYIRKSRKARQSWNAQPTDLVILHQFPRGTTTISLSPFPIKLETFLRMHQIKYINDFDYPYSPDQHKSPWITVNGEDISDSQLAIEFLAKKFSIDLGSGLSPKDKAISRSVRALLEDHLYWVLMVERYVHHEARHLRHLVKKMHNNDCIHNFIFDKYRRLAVKKMTQQTLCQGLGRHSRGDIHKMGIEDLQAVSNFLGTQTYLLGGDHPTDLDAVLFGFECFILHSSPPDSVFKALVEKRLTNLVDHAENMKTKYFPDWDELITPSITNVLKQLPELEQGKEEDSKLTKDCDESQSVKETSSVKGNAIEKTDLTKENGHSMKGSIKNGLEEDKNDSTTLPAKAVHSKPATTEPVKTPIRKPSVPGKHPSPARKLSAASTERVQSPSKKAFTMSTERLHTPTKKAYTMSTEKLHTPTKKTTVNGTHEKKDVHSSEQATKPTRSSIAPVRQSTNPSIKSATTKPVDSPKPSTGTTPKSSTDSRKTSSASKMSNAFSPNNKTAKVISNGASSVFKSMLGKKK